jgi:hypothetical protein
MMVSETENQVLALRRVFQLAVPSDLLMAFVAPAHNLDFHRLGAYRYAYFFSQVMYCLTFPTMP